MIKLGKVQKLKVKDIRPQGAYLGVDDDMTDALLPREELPEEAKKGDTLKVVVYKDSRGRLTASTKKPYAQVGEMATLRVTSKPKFGAFLDWGLDKDVFLPYAQTVGAVVEGREYPVILYIDREDRICASMQLDNFLELDSPYKKDDNVKGTVYSINKKIGIFVAVDNKYSGLIPNEEILGAYMIGDEVEARVFNVKDDGKLDLTLKGRVNTDMSKDVNVILDKLKANRGYLPYNDKSDAADIKREFGISKSAFKKATGNLYRERMIEFKDSGIKLI